jgi:predicted nucleic acid-binding protein
MILCDTGPLVAIIDRKDPDHADCNDALDLLAGELLLTTWPCLTEAMFLLYRAARHAAQDKLWDMVARGALFLRECADDEWPRMRVLMARYASLPMDLADASLVVAAERTGIHRIFTLDGDFRVYLINDKDPFDIVP